MFTPTTRHKLHNTLDEIFDYRSKVFEFFATGAIPQPKKLGYIGDIIAVETPFNDDNGWHVHNHNVMIFDKPIQDQAEFIEKNSYQRGCHHVKRLSKIQSQSP